MSEKIALTVEEAADFTGIGRNTIRELVRAEMVPTLRIGRKVLIRTEDLDSFLILNRNNNLRNHSELTPLRHN